MMKKMILKQLMVIFALTFIATITSYAQSEPPMPTQNPTSQADTAINRTVKGPVGTATLLMLGMGGAVLGYKLKKNKKEE